MFLDDIHKHYSLQSDPIQHSFCMDITLYDVFALKTEYCLNQ